MLQAMVAVAVVEVLNLMVPVQLVGWLGIFVGVVVAAAAAVLVVSAR